ncbi:hypothetical protein AMTR_s00134p00018820 [Amborella trichopoda]|uniref:Uncharacterized protein n=1 Tax=Amborella trichopoda TaxID=13333 RepID=W1P4U7_AMBTC|nr:hypothetical protein AMTR_s00134p00018820 [Amborella trichopoda]
MGASHASIVSSIRESLSSMASPIGTSLPTVALALEEDPMDTLVSSPSCSPPSDTPQASIMAKGMAPLTKS